MTASAVSSHLPEVWISTLRQDAAKGPILAINFLKATVLRFGPFLIGVIFNAILYGVMLMQAFIYYQTFSKDPSWIRYFVLYLFIIETINTGCDIAVIYEPLILQFGTPEAMTYFPLLLAASPVVTVMISTPVQIFTAWRINVISGSKWMGSVISLLALVSLGGGIWTTVNVAIIRVFARKPELNRPGVVWFIAAAVADVFITASLIYSLARRKTGISATDSTINRIIRLSIQTGLVTSIFALTDLICFLISPETTISFIWDFSLSKLYTNALLSTFNARAGWNHLNENGQNPDNVLFGRNSALATSRGQLGTFTSDQQINSMQLHSIPAGISGGYELQSDGPMYKIREGDARIATGKRNDQDGYTTSSTTPYAVTQ